MNKKLIFTLEDVYSCPGKCPGCFLSDDNRSTREPSMSKDVLNKSINRLEEYLINNNHIEELEIILIIGDHLYLPVDYLENVYNGFLTMLDKVHSIKESTFIYSASLYQNYNNALKIFNEHKKFINKSLPVRVNIVLDPINKIKRNKLWNEQLSIIEYLKKDEDITFEISMNLSRELLEYINPDEYFKMALDFETPEIIINWTPSVSNANYTYNDLDYIEKWIVEFTKIIINSDLKVKSDYITSILNQLNSNTDKRNAIKNIESFMLSYIYIDSDGFILPCFDVVGDVPHHKNLGYEQKYHVDDYTLEQAIKKSTPEVHKQMVKSISLPVCRECNYRDLCMFSGYHVYSDFAKKYKSSNLLIKNRIDSNQCPHVGSSIFPLVYNYWKQEKSR